MWPASEDIPNPTRASGCAPRRALERSRTNALPFSQDHPLRPRENGRGRSGRSPEDRPRP
jgi:hypothetical protein